MEIVVSYITNMAMGNLSLQLISALSLVCCIYVIGLVPMRYLCCELGSGALSLIFILYL